MSEPVKASEMTPSPYERALADISSTKWKQYLEIGVPALEEANSRVEAMRTPRQMARVGGLAGSAVTAGLAPKIQQDMTGRVAAGGSPGGSAFGARVAQLRAGAADAVNEADVGARLDQTGRYLGGLDDLVSAGNGIGASGQLSMSRLAEQAANRSQANSRLKFAEAEQGGQIAGTALGLGGSLLTNGLMRKYATK